MEHQQGYATSPTHASQPTEGSAQTVTSTERAERRALRRLSGVVEARPGIIESSHIAPLDDDQREDEPGRGRSMAQAAQEQLKSLKERASEGVSNIMYGITAGNQKAMQAGKEASK